MKVIKFLKNAVSITLKKIKKEKGFFLVLSAILIPIIVTFWYWVLTPIIFLNLNMHQQISADAAALSGIAYRQKLDNNDINYIQCLGGGGSLFFCLINCLNNGGNITDCINSLIRVINGNNNLEADIANRSRLILAAIADMNDKTRPTETISLSNDIETLTVSLESTNQKIYFSDDVTIVAKSSARDNVLLGLN